MRRQSKIRNKLIKLRAKGQQEAAVRHVNAKVPEGAFVLLSTHIRVILAHILLVWCVFEAPDQCKLQLLIDLQAYSLSF